MRLLLRCLLDPCTAPDTPEADCSQSAVHPSNWPCKFVCHSSCLSMQDSPEDAARGEARVPLSNPHRVLVNSLLYSCASPRGNPCDTVTRLERHPFKSSGAGCRSRESSHSAYLPDTHSGPEHALRGQAFAAERRPTHWSRGRPSLFLDPANANLEESLCVRTRITIELGATKRTELSIHSQLSLPSQSVSGSSTPHSTRQAEA